MKVAQVFEVLFHNRIHLASLAELLRAPVSFSIGLLHDEIQHDDAGHGDDGGGEIDPVALVESRRSVVDLTRHDAVALDEDLAHPDGHGPFREAAVHGVDPHHAEDDTRVYARQDETKSGHERHFVGRRQQDDEAGDGDAEAAKDQKCSVVETVRDKWDDGQSDEPECVGDDRVELGVQGGEAEFLDEGGQENRKATDAHGEACDHEGTQVELGVFEGDQDLVVPDPGIFGVLSCENGEQVRFVGSRRRGERDSKMLLTLSHTV